MDTNRFDSLTKTISTTATRRGLLRRIAALPLIGSLAVLLGPTTTQAEGSGAIVGGGNRRRNRGGDNHKPRKRREHHTTCGKKCDPCERCKKGKCRPKPNCGAPPTPTCPGLKQTCDTEPGTPCCPDIDPNVVCGGYAFQTCQDCTQAPTAEGALCQDPLGNQCCGGSPNCFSAVPVETATHGPAVCLEDARCREGDEPCTSDAQCLVPLFTVCVRSSDISPCNCPGDTPTMCGKPCTTP